jgi:hypothetical protein
VERRPGTPISGPASGGGGGTSFEDGAIDALTENGSPDGAADYVAIEDAGVGLRKTLIDDIVATGRSQFATGVFSGYDSTGGTEIVGGADVPLDAESRKSASVATHSTSTAPAEVTINKTTTYRIVGRISAELASGATRSSSRVELQRDPLGVGSFALVPGTRAFTYHRTTAPEGTATFEVILALTATDIIKMVATDVNGSPTSVTLIADGSSLSIQEVQLP